MHMGEGTLDFLYICKARGEALLHVSQLADSSLGSKVMDFVHGFREQKAVHEILQAYRRVMRGTFLYLQMPNKGHYVHKLGLICHLTVALSIFSDLKALHKLSLACGLRLRAGSPCKLSCNLSGSHGNIRIEL